MDPPSHAIVPQFAPPIGFVCYSRKDRRKLDQFLPHLKSIEPGGKARFWNDEQIKAGEEFTPVIQAAIAHAQVFVLFLSPYFLISDYIRDIEYPAILERRKDNPNSVLVMRVVLDPCFHDQIEGDRQAVPTHDGLGVLQPITKWGKHKHAYQKAAAEIKDAMEAYGLLSGAKASVGS